MKGCGGLEWDGEGWSGRVGCVGWGGVEWEGGVLVGQGLSERLGSCGERLSERVWRAGVEWEGGMCVVPHPLPQTCASSSHKGSVPELPDNDRDILSQLSPAPLADGGQEELTTDGLQEMADTAVRGGEGKGGGGGEGRGGVYCIISRCTVPLCCSV